jgi:hypothetical protein
MARANAIPNTSTTRRKALNGHCHHRDRRRRQPSPQQANRSLSPIRSSPPSKLAADAPGSMAHFPWIKTNNAGSRFPNSPNVSLRRLLLRLLCHALHLVRRLLNVLLVTVVT